MAENRLEILSETKLRNRQELYENLDKLLEIGRMEIFLLPEYTFHSSSWMSRDALALFLTINAILDKMSDEEWLKAAEKFRPKNADSAVECIKNLFSREPLIVETAGGVSMSCWLMEWSQLHCSGDEKVKVCMNKHLKNMESGLPDKKMEFQLTEKQIPSLKRIFERMGSLDSLCYFDHACRRARLPLFETFLMLGVDVNKSAFENISPLARIPWYRTAVEKIKIAKGLLARGANVNASNGTHQQNVQPQAFALFNACASMNMEAVALLVACGADLNPMVEPKEKLSLIEMLCINNGINKDSVKMVRYLLAQGAHLNEEAFSFLRFILERIDDELKNVSVEGYSDTSRDYFGGRSYRKDIRKIVAKMRKLRNSEFGCFRQLKKDLAARSENPFLEPPISLNGHRVSFELLEAARAGNLSQVNELLAAYVPRTGVDAEGNTALHLACMKKPAEVSLEQQVEVVKALLEACVGAVDCKNNKQSTPLQIARASENSSIAELLIQHGADPDQKCVDRKALLSASALPHLLLSPPSHLPGASPSSGPRDLSMAST